MSLGLSGNTIQSSSIMNFDGVLFEKGIGLITVEDLAKALGFASKTIRNWVSARKIPFVMIGRKTFFRLKSIEAWLDEKEYKSWQL